MAHSPIIAPVNPLTLTAPRTVLCCPQCLDTLTPKGTCLNIGSCPDADRAATRSVARGATVKAAPAAWTRRGNVD
jgi:hypothetical protein